MLAGWMELCSFQIQWPKLIKRQSGGDAEKQTNLSAVKIRRPQMCSVWLPLSPCDPHLLETGQIQQKSKAETPRGAREMSPRVNSPKERTDLKPYLCQDLFRELIWNLNTGTNYFLTGLVTPRALLLLKGRAALLTIQSHVSQA